MTVITSNLLSVYHQILSIMLMPSCTAQTDILMSTTKRELGPPVVNDLVVSHFCINWDYLILSMILTSVCCRRPASSKLTV
eukprot:COSAG01_NODE_30133_length_622_cov_0.757170_2_plen_80_part_01